MNQVPVKANSLTLFHTAEINVGPFDALVRELAPNLSVRHVVNEGILREAKAAGTVTSALAALVDRTMSEVMGDGGFVLCTCSTIGALAEHGRPNVLRVDRPMAERAVALGSRIAIAATLPSTLGPTRALLEQVAGTAGATIDIIEWDLDRAWPFMERGDQPGYAAEIARDVTARVAGSSVDVVVLAQASMAGAAEMLTTLRVPVLASPRLGVEAAVRRVRAEAR